MKRMWIALVVMLGMAAPALAVDFTFHGDLNHRFRLYTNQVNFFDGAGNSWQSMHKKAITEEDNNDLMGEIKYRLWTEMASDDGAIKGVYAIEVGGIQFGSGTDGDFSGDGVDVETRWAYTDFALGSGRAKIGLQTFTVNKFIWQETATGIDYSVPVGNGNVELAWMRGYERPHNDSDLDHNDFDDLDALYARYNFSPAEGTKMGLFALWQHSDGDTLSDGATGPNYNYVSRGGFTTLDLDLYTLGFDGTLAAGNFFANWDLFYQFGDLMEEVDFGGYFAHLDVGAKMGKGKLMFTSWYASGDDDATDDDYDAFVATDIDINSEYSVVLFEGYTDDDYFAEAPYLMDKGMILFRLGYDHQTTDKLKVGLSAAYLMTAEDIEYLDNNGIARSDDEIGVEVDAYVSYKLFSSTEVALQAGYLMTGDAMDYYEVDCDGSADEDIYIINSRLRYSF